MKPFILLIILSILLCGCASSPEATELSTIPTESIAVTAPPASTVPETLPPDKIDILLSTMTAEQKVGQLFLARCPRENTVQDITDYHLSGYLLFAVDFETETPESVTQKIQSWQHAADIPLLIAVDEEGGTVTRVSKFKAFRSEKFPAPRKIYASGGLDAILETEKEKCLMLADLGINVNLAPVCDIATDQEAFMYRRSLGLSPVETAEVISEMVQTMNDQSIGSVLKHFPGYGNNSDTHTCIVTDSKTLEELETNDLLPFRAGINAGCGAILVSHTIVEAMDPDSPASLSAEVHRYLREDMGFDGVIITDDLIMDAITDAYGSEEAAVLAVLAGNDLLCSSDYIVQYEAVLSAVRDGRISEEQLDSSVRRILQWKKNLGLL